MLIKGQSQGRMHPASAQLDAVCQLAKIMPEAVMTDLLIFRSR